MEVRRPLRSFILLLLICIATAARISESPSYSIPRPSEQQLKSQPRAYEEVPFPFVPHIAGIRMEDLAHPAPKVFLGYTDSGETIVEPDTKGIIVVFGFWLQEVEYLAFTDSNCITAEMKILEHEFKFHTDRRIELAISFPDVDESWRMCVKQRGDYGELLLIDDIRTWITTTATIPQHFLPLSAQIAILSVLFSLSALFSGLNLGLMSLSIQELQLIINSGSVQESKDALLILPIRKRGNQLLCTILLMNVVVNSAISILFEDLTSGTVAFVVASLGIVIFGEIVPQSVCVKNGLAVGARTIFLTKFFMWLTWPLAKPISKIIDCVLGEEVDRYNRKRLIEILKMQTKHENKDLSAELKIAVGAMEIAHKCVRDVMTRIDDAFMLSEDEVLNNVTVAHIIKKGYARIPIYQGNDRNKVRSLLFVKDLALVNLRNNVKAKEVSQLNGRILRIVKETMLLPDLLEEFKKGDYHLAMVVADPDRDETWISNRLAEFKQADCSIALIEQQRRTTDGREDSSDDFEEDSEERHERADELRPLTSEAACSNSQTLSSSYDEQKQVLVGLVTLEDIIEEILQAEIIDESDTITDNVHRLKRRHANELISVKLNTESRADPLQMHTLEVVIAWLKSHFSVFSESVMEVTILNRLVQSNIRQVTITSKSGSPEGKKAIQIFGVGQPSKRAILVLEGNLDAFFPHSEMHFSAGPWASFGGSQLIKCFKDLSENSRVSTLEYIPDFELTTLSSCKFLQIPFASVVHAYKVSQFVRMLSPSHTLNSSTKSEEMTHKKLSDPPPRKLSDIMKRANCVTSKKSVAF